MVGEACHGAALLADVHRNLHFHTSQHGFPGALWVGLRNRNLPGYITIKPAHRTRRQKLGLRVSARLRAGNCDWPRGHAGFGDPEGAIEYLVNQGLNRENSGTSFDMIQAIKPQAQGMWKLDDELETRIQSFEMGFRMQAEAQKVFDVSGESEATKKLTA